jgi:hypothetical protein
MACFQPEKAQARPVPAQAALWPAPFMKAGENSARQRLLASDAVRRRLRRLHLFLPGSVYPLPLEIHRCFF